MAKYTIELRRICEILGRDTVESWFKDYRLEDALTPEQIQAINKYGVWTKEKLAEQIVDHYYMREIGFETPALFQHYAKITMKEIMPRYLLKIYTQFLEYDPLSSVDYTEEYTREITGNTNGESTSSSSNSASGLSISNNTPQTRITRQNLDSGVYASNVSQSDTIGSVADQTNASSNSNTVEKYTHSMKGDNGVIVTNQYLVKEFRDIAASFNEEIIYEISKLFMGLY